MYDFWFTMGVAIMKPSVLDDFNSVNPEFNFVPKLVVDMNVGMIPVPRKLAPRTGLLTTPTAEKDPTTALRLQISKSVRAAFPGAPPIGIYVSARFSQMLKIPFFSSALPNASGLVDIVKLANAAYTKATTAVGAPTGNVLTFPAFLGLCIMDGNFVTALAQLTAAAMEVLGEFGIANPSQELKIAQSFVSQNEFPQASNLLMASDSSSWTDSNPTFEQIFFWKGKTEIAVP
jgi:hypothetical protein